METKQNKYFTLDFADQKDVDIVSVVIKNIYSGLLAGKRSDFTNLILNSSKKDTTFFNLTEDQFEPHEENEDRVLRPYKYLITARKYVSEMTVLWFDYAPSEDKSLKEIISQHVANINFDDYAEELDW